MPVPAVEESCAPQKLPPRFRYLHQLQSQWPIRIQSRVVWLILSLYFPVLVHVPGKATRYFSSDIRLSAHQGSHLVSPQHLTPCACVLSAPTLDPLETRGRDCGYNCRLSDIFTPLSQGPGPKPGPAVAPSSFTPTLLRCTFQTDRESGGRQTLIHSILSLVLQTTPIFLLFCRRLHTSPPESRS